MQKIRWALWILGIVLVLALLLQNQQSAEVDLLWMHQEMPLALMLVATLGVGVVMGALMTAMMLRRPKNRSAGNPSDKKANAANRSADPAAST